MHVYSFLIQFKKKSLLFETVNEFPAYSVKKKILPYLILKLNNTEMPL